MKSKYLYYLLGLSALFLLSGCVVRTYTLTRDRVDQDLTTGNRGYLKGVAPLPEERKTTRNTNVVEIELRSPLKFEKSPKAQTYESTAKRTEEVEPLEGNQGYLTEKTTPEIAAPQESNMGKYTVQKGDTLQKISQKLYGTTKGWGKIFEANKDTLKGPNKIYVGQVLNIPGESLKEPEANLK